MENLRNYCAAKTMVMITHRNPIFAMVDRVLVFENGSIIADKTPSELGLSV